MGKNTARETRMTKETKNGMDAKPKAHQNTLSP